MGTLVPLFIRNRYLHNIHIPDNVYIDLKNVKKDTQGDSYIRLCIMSPEKTPKSKEFFIPKTVK